MSELKPCQWCGRPASKLYHHGEYARSDNFWLDDKNKVYLYVCGHCGKVTIVYED